MNSILNGTAWGELPTQEIDIEIPAFMLPENRYRRQAREWREHNEQARQAATIGAERSQQRRKFNQKETDRKNNLMGLLVIPGVIGFMALSLWLMEVVL